MNSVDEISKMFQTESEKLKNLINTTDSKSELSLPEIVETYYQIMNVSSMAIMLGQQLSKNRHKSLLDKISETQKLISTKFNLETHPKIMMLSFKFNSRNNKEFTISKSNRKIKRRNENESKIFEELRRKMSTKEFVEQYDKGLLND